jgi:hypothetical protein
LIKSLTSPYYKEGSIETFLKVITRYILAQSQKGPLSLEKCNPMSHKAFTVFLPRSSSMLIKPVITCCHTSVSRLELESHECLLLRPEDMKIAAVRFVEIEEGNGYLASKCLGKECLLKEECKCFHCMLHFFDSDSCDDTKFVHVIFCDH